MSHTISNPAKLTVQTVHGNNNTINGAIQTALRALAAGDKVVDISITRKSVGNNCFAVITYEDQ